MSILEESEELVVVSSKGGCGTCPNRKHSDGISCILADNLHPITWFSLCNKMNNKHNTYVHAHLKSDLKNV